MGQGMRTFLRVLQCPHVRLILGPTARSQGLLAICGILSVVAVTCNVSFLFMTHVASVQSSLTSYQEAAAMLTFRLENVQEVFTQLLFNMDRRRSVNAGIIQLA